MNLNIINLNEEQITKKQKTNIIGFGSYGYVYKPSLFTQSDNYVTKVFSNTGSNIYDDKNDEEKNINKINKIDPEYKFTLKREFIKVNDEFKTEFDSTILLNINNINSNIIDLNKNVSFINMEYGGKPFTKLKDIDFNTFWDKLYILVNGIKTLNDNGIIHRDVKEQNILFTKERFNLIDFGLTTDKEKVYNKINLKILSNEYPFFPPEYRIISFLYLNESKFEFLIKELGLFYDNMDCFFTKLKYTTGIVKELFEYSVQNFVTKYAVNFGYYNKNFMKILYHVNNVIESLYIFIKNTVFYSIHDLIQKYFKDCEMKIDIYGLGMTLYFVKYKIFKKNEISRTNKINYMLLEGLTKKMIIENVFERASNKEILNDILEIKKMNIK
jgi:serine/threonine protein kinase